MTTRRNQRIARLYTELSRTYAALAAAVLEDEDGAALPSLVVTNPARAEPEPRAPKRQAPMIVPADGGRSDLSKVDRKVLLALAQLGRPLNMDELSFFAGISRTSGSLGQSLADLRKERMIEGPGSEIGITHLGREALGEFTPLPTGYALFEYWCEKLGGAAEKVLRAIREARRAVNMDEVAESAGMSRTSGSLGQALADLRKMRLIVGPGAAMTLSPDFLRAIAPTIGVFNTTSGKSVKLDARKGHATT